MVPAACFALTSDVRPAFPRPAATLFLCGSLILLLGLLGQSSLDRTQEARVLVTAREMLASGALPGYLIPHCNGEVRLHKPPLAYWLSAGSFRVFGIHDWAGRIPMALAAWLTLLATYAIGRRLVGARAALLGCILLLGSLLFFRYGRMAETDILVTLFNTLAVGAMILGWRHEGRRAGLLWHASSGIAIGLAVLAKGLPAVYPVIFLVLLAWWTGRWRTILDWLRSGALLWAVLIALPWFVYISQTPEWSRVPHEAYKVLRGEGHWRLPGTHLGYLAKAALPWTPLVIIALIAAVRQFGASLRVRILLAWVLSAYVPLEIAMQKQEHYLLPLMPGLMLLVGLLLARPGGQRWLPGAARIVFWGMAVVYGAAVALIPIAGWRIRNALQPLDLVLALLAGAAAISIAIQLRRGNFARGLWTSAVAGTLLMAAGIGLWAPNLARDDFREIAAELREHYPSATIAIYGNDMLPLAFYLQRTLPAYEEPAQLQQAWGERRFTLIVAEKDQLDHHAWPAGVPLRRQMHFDIPDNDILVFAGLRPR